VLSLHEFQKTVRPYPSWCHQVYSEQLRKKPETHKERFWMFPNLQQESKSLEETSESLGILQDIWESILKIIKMNILQTVEFSRPLDTLRSHLESILHSSFVPSTQYHFDRQIAKSLKWWDKVLDVNLAEVKRVEKALRNTVSSLRRI
jgi:hypothetical protein